MPSRPCSRSNTSACHCSRHHRGTQLNDEADLARLVASASIGKLVWVLFGWTLAAFVGAWVASRISRKHRIGAAISVGVFIVAGVVLNVSMLPHPLWMTVAGIALPIPAAWCAARIGQGSRPSGNASA